jgi:hypothetical protein
MALSEVIISWLINLPGNTIQTWDELCTLFIGNF